MAANLINENFKNSKHSADDDDDDDLSDYASGYDDNICLSDPETTIDCSTLQKEIKSYVAQPKSDLTEFYKKNHATFTRLTASLEKIMCIPSTSVPCERLFSHAGFQVLFFYFQKI